jgi:hypothetical protein
MAVSAVVEVAIMLAPSTPISAPLCQNAAARIFGICASSRGSRDVSARWRFHTALPARMASVTGAPSARTAADGGLGEREQRPCCSTRQSARRANQIEGGIQYADPAAWADATNEGLGAQLSRMLAARSIIRAMDTPFSNCPPFRRQLHFFWASAAILESE